MRPNQTMQPTHVYEVRPRSDKRGFDLISDVLPFGRLWYNEPDAISNAVGYAFIPLLSTHGATARAIKSNPLYKQGSI
ncbi:MAG: hypothetical protein ACRD6N_14950 [Pyrinomonadaceae bacterium]